MKGTEKQIKWAEDIKDAMIPAMDWAIANAPEQIKHRYEIIKAAIPAKARREGPHPAKRTFQAIRIALNDELAAVEDAMDEMIDLLGDHGRLCVITFHSLEDRIVKSAFKRNENPCTCPPDFPVCVCGKKPKGKVITKKPILPAEEEMKRNPRAKSAKLRVFERIMSSGKT